jgi:hypothetical protein
MNVQSWATLTTDAVTNSLRSVVFFIPKVIGAAVVILIGALVAWAVKTAIVRLLKLIRVKPYTDAIGLNKVFTQTSV